MSEDWAPPAKKSRQSTIEEAFTKQQSSLSNISSLEEGQDFCPEEVSAVTKSEETYDKKMANNAEKMVGSGSKQPKFDDDDDDDLEDDAGMTIMSSSQFTGPKAMGASETELIRETADSANTALPQVNPSMWHQVLMPTKKDVRPRYQDKWNDKDYVRMPCSEYSKLKGRGSYEPSRWNTIQEVLCHRTIHDADDLKDAIFEYNPSQRSRWDFTGLNNLFAQEPRLKSEFFQQTLPKMADIIKRTKEIFPEPPKLLKKSELPQMVSMTQEQAACILCHGFFCTFPNRNSKSRDFDFPEANFSGLFMGGSFRANNRLEKLKCLLNYFKRVTEKMPDGVLTYRRQLIKDPPKWDMKGETLGKLRLDAVGNIEDDGEGMLQVDFANKYLGGGVLGRGCVQEEIRFIICPEMIVSRLLCEALGDRDCLIMTGCQRYSKYKGYADTFRFDGGYFDNTPRDHFKRRLTEVVAIDARVFTHEYVEQFNRDNVTRELNKAYCGFMKPNYQQSNDKKLPAVATGNWGCGAFGGDPQLKALIQMMAAAVAGRDVCFFTFYNHQLMKDISGMHKFATEQNLDVAQLFAFTHGYFQYLKQQRNKSSRKSFYDYIYEKHAKSEEYDSQSLEGNASSPDYRASTP